MNPAHADSPLGIIDVGSNSIKLLVAQKTDHQELRILASHTLTERISRGISKAVPLLAEDSMQRGVDTISKLVELAHNHQVSHVEIVATSAVRDAQNSDDFQQKVLTATGYPLKVLTGEQEAQAIGRGLLMDPRIRNSEEVQVIDLGGGSLEYLHFLSGKPTQIESYQLGSVRLTEEAAAAGFTPQNPGFRSWIQERIHSELNGVQPCKIFNSQSTPLYGAGGSLFSIHQLALKTGAISGNSIPTDLLGKLYEQILPLSLEERAALPGVQAGRADILPTAIATIEEFCRIAQQDEITLCPFNLRFGLAAEILGTTSVDDTSPALSCELH